MDLNFFSTFDSRWPLLTLWLSCLLGLFYWRRLPRPLPLLVVYLWFNLFIEIGAKVAKHQWNNNLPLLHLYTLGEFWLLSAFYRQALGSTSILCRYFFQIIGIVSGAMLLNTLFLQDIYTYNSYAKTLGQVLLILYALDYTFRFLENRTEKGVQTKALRLINSAVLFYYCSSLFIFMFSQFGSNNENGYRIFWKVNVGLILIFQLLVLFALCRVIFSPPPSPSSSASAS